MFEVEELMRAAKTYERAYNWNEMDFEWCLDVGEECGFDPWKIAERKKELEGVQFEARKRREEEYKVNGASRDWFRMDSGMGARGQEEHLELYLAMMWAKPLGLWPTRADGMACKQVLDNPHARSGLFDHTYWFRTGSGRPKLSDRFVIATHPYGVAERYKAEAKAFADDVGAVVEYPEFPSWWVPAEYDADGSLRGGTTLVVWKAAPNADEIRPQGLYNSISGRLNEVEMIETGGTGYDGAIVTFRDGSQKFVKGSFGHKLFCKWMGKRRAVG